MKLSTSLMVLAVLLTATTWKWPFFRWDDRTIGQIYQDVKAGRQRSSPYARGVAPVALLLMIISVYLALTWR
jgi:hypothetical protein